MSGLADENASEAEVLTGAQLYAHLVRQNQSRTETAQARVREYVDLQITLRDLTQRCRRRLLAPVAGGLAYFEAELTNTNNILVLLGDGWFAERSASQAAELAGRRIDYLRNELRVLHAEAKSLAEQEQIFVGEVATQESLKVLSAASPPPLPTSPSSSARKEAAEDDAANAPLDVFDEQDELTEDELIAIERELGDRVNDDAYVEKVMLERMIAKKEKRMQAEMQRRAAIAPPTSSTPSHAVETHTTKRTDEAHEVCTNECASQAEFDDSVARSNNVTDSGAFEEKSRFRTPADIGPLLVSPSTDSTDVSENVVAEPRTSESMPTEAATAVHKSCMRVAAKPVRHVTFAKTISSPIDDRDAAATVAEIGSAALSAAPGSDRSVSRTRAEAPSDSTTSSYRIGSIVERSVANTTTTASATLSPAPHVAPKRVSLFRQGCV